MAQFTFAKFRNALEQSLPGVGILGVLLFCLKMMAWSYGLIDGAHPLSFKSVEGLIQGVNEVYQAIDHQVTQIQVLERENQRLRLEAEALKVQFQRLQFDFQRQNAERQTIQVENKLTQETGDKIGRTLLSMSYRPPVDLTPAQLFTLALTYLKGFEDEKAAVILSSLTHLENTDLYRTPEILLLTGMVWYRVNNLTMAEAYFDEVLRHKGESQSLPYFAQARLWKAVLAKQHDKEIKAQYWLNELLENHPHSAEVQWINPLEEEHGKKTKL